MAAPRILEPILGLAYFAKPYKQIHWHVKISYIIGQWVQETSIGDVIIIGKTIRLLIQGA